MSKQTTKDGKATRGLTIKLSEGEHDLAKRMAALSRRSMSREMIDALEYKARCMGVPVVYC